MNLGNVRRLDPVPVREVSKSICTYVSPDLTSQHGGGLNPRMRNKAGEYDPDGICFQL